MMGAAGFNSLTAYSMTRLQNSAGRLLLQADALYTRTALVVSLGLSSAVMVHKAFYAGRVLRATDARRAAALRVQASRLVQQ